MLYNLKPFAEKSQFWVNRKMVHFWGIWGTFASFPCESDLSCKIGLCYPDSIIALYHPANFQKKLMSQSWDIVCADVRMYGRTDRADFIGTSRKRWSKKSVAKAANGKEFENKHVNLISSLSIHCCHLTFAAGWVAKFKYNNYQRIHFSIGEHTKKMHYFLWIFYGRKYVCYIGSQVLVQEIHW